MRKIEIKKMGVGSVFKVTIYMLIVPMIFCILIGLITTIIGIATQTYEMIAFGAFIGLGYPIMFVLIYGIFGSLMTLIYNWLAGKFGGLELTIKELEVIDSESASNEESQQI